MGKHSKIIYRFYPCHFTFLGLVRTWSDMRVLWSLKPKRVWHQLSTQSYGQQWTCYMALCYSKTWPSLQAMILPTLINWFSSWRCRASWARIPDTDLAPAVTPFTSHPSSLSLSLSLSLPPSPVIHSWHVKLTSNLAVLQCVINLWDIKVYDSTIDNNHKHFIKPLLGYPKIINELVSNKKSNSSQLRNFAVCQFGN